MGLSCSPISISEFAHLFKLCKPPGGWPQSLGVAFSGGSDSLCLLYLLQKLVQTNRGSSEFPTSIHTITVDHRLQKSSALHAALCAKLAQSFGVQHHERVIPWNEQGFPPIPAPTKSIETLARDCRYRILFDLMTEHQLTTMAMGHHLDDQVETMVIRWARGTRSTGLSGMRNYRRWGMGTSNHHGSLNSYGLLGMRRWIIRPLLTIPKSRILATCKANNLDYIQDPTNFVPSLTIRNNVRAHLATEIYPDNLPDSEVELTICCLMREAVDNLNPEPVETRPLDTLYRYNMHLNGIRDNIDQEVDNILRTSIFPSPPSTLCISSQIPEINSAIRRALIIRVLRYVSPLPWGSPKAEAGRNTQSLERVASHLWGYKEARPFTAGGHVLWSPVKITQKDKLLGPDAPGYLATKGNMVWLASRLPPLSKMRSPPTHLDVTSILQTNLNEDVVEVLWDCRFLVRFKPKMLPRSLRDMLVSGSTKVLIQPLSQYFIPQVVWKKGVDSIGGSIVIGGAGAPGQPLQRYTDYGVEVVSCRTLEVV